jgi:hypothetical protein
LGEPGTVGERSGEGRRGAGRGADGGEVGGSPAYPDVCVNEDGGLDLQNSRP